MIQDYLTQNESKTLEFKENAKNQTLSKLPVDHNERSS